MSRSNFSNNNSNYNTFNNTNSTLNNNNNSNNNAYSSLMSMKVMRINDSLSKGRRGLSSKQCLNQLGEIVDRLMESGNTNSNGSNI